jgi:hypothetical protein
MGLSFGVLSSHKIKVKYVFVKMWVIDTFIALSFTSTLFLRGKRNSKDHNRGNYCLNAGDSSFNATHFSGQGTAASPRGSHLAIILFVKVHRDTSSSIDLLCVILQLSIIVWVRDIYF